MNKQSEFRARIAAGLQDRRAVEAIHRVALHKVESVAASKTRLPNFEQLQALGAQIRRHTLENLPHYLSQFITAAKKVGVRVHFASDAEDARRIICDIARRNDARLAAKSKSMTAEEIELVTALQSIGVRTVETDLGEFVVQIDNDRPSHIVSPIIHKNRRQIAEALKREIGCQYTDDPHELTAAVRSHLRSIFRRCDLGITGVNFAVAQTGSLCICSNEGNARMVVTRPRVLVALMGIEKLVPGWMDLAVMLKLLARSSTGQPLTVYTSLVTGPSGPQEPDGPEQVHVVLLDNGRARILEGQFAEVLRCIRCGGCLNACPVFRNIGGHAYASVYPGPIGSVLTPLLRRLPADAELPRASSLCGACRVACPVQIDIPQLLIKLRAEFRNREPASRRMGIRIWSLLMRSPMLFRWLQRLVQRVLQYAQRRRSGSGFGPLGAWTTTRDLPRPPGKTFRRLWREELSDER